MKCFAGLFPLLVLASPAAQAFDPFSGELAQVKDGNQAYQDQHFESALDKYDSAEQLLREEPRIHFNRGDALFRLGRSKEARDAFLRSMGSDDPELKKQIYYNIGNTFLSDGSPPDAVAYYRRALEIDPKYDDARYNLELAILAMKQQEQDKKDNKDNKDNKDEKDRQQKDEQKKDQQDQKSEENKDQEQPDKKEEEKQDQQKPDEQKSDEQKPDEQKSDEQKPDEQKPDQQQPEKPGEQQKQQEQDEKGEKQPEAEQAKEQQKPESGAGGENETGKMSKAQARDLLDAMHENEKPFQMDRFLIPEFRRKKVEKDW